MTKRNLWLTASLATMSAGVVAICIGSSQIPSGKGAGLYLAGVLGAHLAVLPLKAAERC